MELADLSEALGDQNYRHNQITSDGEWVTVNFPDVEEARHFAGNLMSCGISRSLHNNKVDAKVSFKKAHLDRVIELMGWVL